MTLRRPAVQPRRAPGWRRSGDESYWESFIPEEEPLPQSSRFPRAPRPQSAIEGGQLDVWLEHLRTMQNKVQAPVHKPSFDEGAASTPALEGQPPGRAWRQTGLSSVSAASSSCGSSPSSQESLQTVWLPSPEHRGGWEKAHIVQSPSKENAQLSYLAPVKIGWLPIQRRVMMAGNACSQNQHLDASVSQVKLKQPIIPAFQQDNNTQCYKADTDRSHTSSSAPGVKTLRTADRGFAVDIKETENLNLSAKEGNQSAGWHALRTGWKPKRASDRPRGNNSNEFGREADLIPKEKPLLMTATSTEPVKYSPLHRPASADPTRHDSWQRGANTANTHKPHTPLQRTSSVQPLKATAFYGTNNSEGPSHIQTNSTLTTLVPQNKAGFSSITISSRKVSRSASLPGSIKSPSPSSPDRQPMDPNPGQVRVQRKATIVKVTEQKVISSSAPSTSRPGTPPSGNALDTVVHRRKATIIKVTEHKESYSPGKITPRNPEYRHSYTEGLYKNNSTPIQENPSDKNKAYLNSLQSTATASNTFCSNGNKNEMHRSTLNLFLKNPPVIAPPSLEPHRWAAGQRSQRPQRPQSCYGSFSGHSEQSEESVAELASWKKSSRLPQENPVNHVDFISSGKVPKDAGWPMAADTLTANRDEKERPPLSVDGTRRASPSLTLIKAPDPDSHQSQEEVLALNAAAIIANIKLQRQLSKKKKTPTGESERDSTASSLANPVTNERNQINSKKSKTQYHKQPHAEFIPLMPDHKRSSESASLQRALERSRPEFISRSQERVRALERKVQERKERSGAGKQEWSWDQLRAHSSMGSGSVNGNLFRSTDRSISKREMQFRSKRRVGALSIRRHNN